MIVVVSYSYKIRTNASNFEVQTLSLFYQKKADKKVSQLAAIDSCFGLRALFDWVS